MTPAERAAALVSVSPYGAGLTYYDVLAVIGGERVVVAAGLHPRERADDVARVLRELVADACAVTLEDAARVADANRDGRCSNDDRAWNAANMVACDIRALATEGGK